MSWLNNITDLAGKAESLLNNIDQSAATAISKASTSQNDETVSTNIKPEVLSVTSKNSENETENFSTSIKSTPSKTQLSRKGTSKLGNQQSDEALFNFLNSDQKVSKIKSSPALARPDKLLEVKPKHIKNKASLGSAISRTSKDISGSELSRNTSYDSLISKVSSRRISDNGSHASDHQESNSEPDASVYPADSTASESEFEMVASLASKDSDRDSPGSASHLAGNDTVIENKLLRNELTSLHKELTTTAERNQRVREGLQQKNRDLNSRCDDLEEELKVKNTQFSALNIKFLEVEKLLKLEKKTSTHLKTENDRILRDQSEGSGMHARTIDELRTRLNEIETFLAEEKQAHSQSRQEMLELKSQRDSESRKVVESLQKADIDKQKEQKKIEELTKEIRSLTNNLSLTKQELSDYKQKAARILQSKERLISSLKGSSESEMTSSTIANLELAELKQDNDQLKDDLHATKLQVANIQMEFQEAEQQFLQDQSVLQQEVNGLRRELDEETRGRQEAEFELHRLQEEGRRDREEQSRSRTLNQSRLHDKDVEIERLRNQLMLRSQSTPQESELEARLRQLTEAVIQKQSTVETLAAEKSSLVLQLERMEGQVKRLSQAGSSHTRVNMHDEDNRSNSNGVLFSHGSEQGMVGKVKKAASALDRFSIRLGVFLKRYPPARLFLLIYMGILHLWVMIVLLTYTPESHDEDFLKSLKHDKNL